MSNFTKDYIGKKKDVVKRSRASNPFMRGSAYTPHLGSTIAMASKPIDKNALSTESSYAASWVRDGNISQHSPLAPLHIFIHNFLSEDNSYNELIKRAEIFHPSANVYEKPIVKISYFNNKEHTVKIIEKSYETKVERLLTKASSMLQLPFNWDDDEAMPIEKEFFDISSKFVKDYLIAIKNNYFIEVQLPEINPCPDGSIDLDWLTPHAQLLINIRKDNENNDFIAYYYGDRHSDKTQFKGSTPTNEFSESLAVWMKYLK